MDTKSAILALLGAWGVGTCAAVVPTPAQEAVESAEQDNDRGHPLLNKVWVRSGAADALPGPMQIFLADGTLVSDSCWETYRLSKWQQVSPTAITWDEDGMTIYAQIASVSDSELVLNLLLGGAVEEQRFVSAAVPYVCPDMVK